MLALQALSNGWRRRTVHVTAQNVVAPTTLGIIRQVLTHGHRTNRTNPDAIHPSVSRSVPLVPVTADTPMAHGRRPALAIGGIRPVGLDLRSQYGDAGEILFLQCLPLRATLHLNCGRPRFAHEIPRGVLHPFSMAPHVFLQACMDAQNATELPRPKNAFSRKVRRFYLSDCLLPSGHNSFTVGTYDVPREKYQ